MLGRCSSTLALPLALVLLGGCESFGRGAAEAVMQATSKPGEDTRMCDVEGRPFGGIEPHLRSRIALAPFSEGVGQRPEVKVLYVHGIGTHEPGHGTALMTNLANALALDVRSPRPKRIVISAPAFKDKPLGELRVTRLTDARRQRDMLFYRTHPGLPSPNPTRTSWPSTRTPYYQLRRATLESIDAHLRQRHRP